MVSQPKIKMERSFYLNLFFIPISNTQLELYNKQQDGVDWLGTPGVLTGVIAGFVYVGYGYFRLYVYLP